MATAVLKPEHTQRFEDFISSTQQSASTLHGIRKTTPDMFVEFMSMYGGLFDLYNEPLSVQKSQGNVNVDNKRYSAVFNVSVEALMGELGKNVPAVVNGQQVMEYGVVKKIEAQLKNDLISLNIDCLNKKAEWHRFKTIGTINIPEESKSTFKCCSIS